MKILWITNVPVGEHCKITGEKPVVGGWLKSALEELREVDSIKLCVATTWKVNTMEIVKDANIEYAIIPGGLAFQYNHKNKKNIEWWKKLIQYFQPDIIHIHGTEFSLGRAIMQACPDNKFVISIQGLCLGITRYYFAGLKIKDIFQNITLRDIIKRDTMFHAKRKFQKRAILEKQYLQKINNVIGRTTWDYVHCKLINPEINYYFCNESLRHEFYDKNWDIKKIIRHTIFVVQACYPIKGMHILLKAIFILKRNYPDVKLYIAGKDLVTAKSFIKKIKSLGYANYLRKLIIKYNLQDNLIFTGELDAEQMVTYYQKSHVFVCPSSIENSPNSLGEAQLIGTPCVASFAGGIPDMVNHYNTGLLYRFEEYEMLAYYIRCIFDNDNLAIKLSQNEKEVAKKRHNRQENTSQLLTIYRKIADQSA